MKGRAAGLQGIDGYQIVFPFDTTHTGLLARIESAFKSSPTLVTIHDSRSYTRNWDVEQSFPHD